ncbi:MAG TPA: NAD-dependent epimerase/dehydratase family protein [Gaiellaceae bacterium]|jgi:dihydroflavonol-4-reductase|nr:NAD-dependent epimerase/dehydratase family protein [Gaiellaceae bacterium]
MSSGSVVVTGGTGFLGRAIVERLVGGGEQVRALARSDGAARALAALGAEPVPGDVLDADTLTAAMRGSEVVYHAAGANAYCLRDPSPLFEVNVRGSENVVRAASWAGARRVVYTSSAATLGEASGTIGSERSPHRGWFLSSYERSKFEAERAVFAAAHETGIELVSVNPASVQGPGRSGGSARLLLDFLNGRLKAIVDSRLSLVDIADCTDGHLLAASRGTPGERYVLSGATLTVREGLALVASLLGVKRSVRTLPPSLALGVATAAELLARLGRGSPRICRELARTLIHGHAYDGSKATRALGLRYTPVEETLRRTVDWWVEQRLVARPRAS